MLGQEVHDADKPTPTTSLAAGIATKGVHMAPMPFGKLLKQDSVVSSQELEEAYQRQVLFGGRLGTNLLEIKALDEATLLEYLSRSAGIPWAGRELIEKPDWDLAERVDVELVQRFKAFPARRIGRSVIAVVTDPLSGPRLHEFESSLGATIVQHITSEFRFWQLLKRAYDLELPPRYATLIERFPLDKSPADSRLPLAKDKDDLDSIEQPDLSLQRALEATLMERHSSKTPPSPVISAGSRKLSPKNIGSNRFGGGTLIGFQNVFTPPEGHKNTEDDQPRVPSTPRLKSPPKFPSDLTPTPTPAPSNATAQPEPDLAATPSAPKAAAEPPPAAAVLVKKKRRRKKKRSTSAGPLSLPAFVQQLEHSQDREELLNAFAAFVTSYGSRCAMLAYEADKLTGIAVHGKRGAFPIPQVEIRLRPGSDIFRVCQGRSYYQGGAATGELASLFRQLKVPSPDEVLVVPIAIGASLELLAILDNGATPLVYSPDLVLRGALELSRALQPFAKRQPSTPAQVPEAPAKADVGEPETHASAEKPVAAEAGIEIEDFAEAAVEAEAVEAEAVEAEAVEAEAVEAEAVEAEAAVEAEVAVEAEATVEAEAANPEPHSSGPEALDIPEPAESGGEDMDIPDLDFSLSGIGDEDDEEDIPSLSTSSDATRSDAASMEIDEATAEQDALLDLSIDELPSDPEPLSQEHLRLPTLQVISLDEIEKAAEAAEREKAAQAALDRTSSSDESLPEIDAVELLSDDGLDLIEVELVPDSEDDLGSLSRSDFEFWLTNLDGRDEVLAERAREIFTSESPAVRAFLLRELPWTPAHRSLHPRPRHPPRSRAQPPARLPRRRPQCRSRSRQDAARDLRRHPLLRPARAQRKTRRRRGRRRDGQTPL